MKTTSRTAIIKGDGDWWIGWVEEVPGVNGQERSREELLTSLANRPGLDHG
jgi:predicted RNase H-like HicB family nuclease